MGGQSGPGGISVAGGGRCPGTTLRWLLGGEHHRGGQPDEGNRGGGSLQKPGLCGTGLPVPQDGGLGDPAHGSQKGRPPAQPRVLMRAGLLRLLAHAPAPAAAI